MICTDAYGILGRQRPDAETDRTNAGHVADRLLLREDIDAGHTVGLRSFCTVKNLSVVGALDGITLPDAVGQRHGLAFLGDAQAKVHGSVQAHNSIISGCFISGFTDGGITCTDTGYRSRCAMTVTDCPVFNCGAGIHISHFSEYHMFTNIIAEAEGCFYWSAWISFRSTGSNAAPYQ